MNNGAVRFLYGTMAGRGLLKAIQSCGIAAAAARFLRSPLSRPLIGWYIRRHRIPMEEYEEAVYGSFQDFFARKKTCLRIDPEPSHLISPCDGWLSAYPIGKDSSFAIKGSRYRVRDLLGDAELGSRYEGGTCLILRLCASDYHRYCFLDDGVGGRQHFIEGRLHSVQPIACGTYPVYTLNRRAWRLLLTDHFGPVVQVEVGALMVGGIHNERVEGRFYRGMEKGHFELSGSTIVLLFQKNRMQLLPRIEEQLKKGEVRVSQGMRIGTRFS